MNLESIEFDLIYESIASISHRDVFISLLRWFIGTSVGCFIGLIAGILSVHPIAERIFAIPRDGLRALPIIGLVPLVQAFFGIAEPAKIGLIAWGVMFPVWISVKTYSGSITKEAEFVARAHELNLKENFMNNLGPKVLVGFLRGIEIAIGLGWLAVVAAELIATQSRGFWAGGLGFQLFSSFDKGQELRGIVCLLIFACLGIATTLAWRIYARWFVERLKLNPELIRS